MTIGTRRAVCFLSGLMLGGCGAEEAPPALTLTPSPLILELDPGVSIPVVINARPHFTASGSVYTKIVDAEGVLTQDFGLAAKGDGTYDAMLNIAPTLSKGRHTGTLFVHVCPSTSCTEEYPGSPVGLPYEITIGTPPNLTPLTPLAGAADWRMHQLDAAHTGYVPATLDPAAFSTRWRWIAETGEIGSGLSAPVVAAGIVYTSQVGLNALLATSKLYAIDENDGTVRWTKDFGAIYAVNPPAVSGNAVFAATSGHEATALWSFDAASGTERFRTPFRSQWERYYAPTIIDNGVYTNGGSLGGLLRFDATTGTQDWFVMTLGTADEWTPAVDGARAYAITGNTVSALNRDNGGTVWQVNLEGTAIPGSGSCRVPVLDGKGGVLARSGIFKAHTPSDTLTRLVAADGSKSWVVTGAFTTDPVVAGDMVYVTNDRQLEARSLEGGEELWQWVSSDAAETGFTGNLIVTENLLFLSTNLRTYAIDLTTHASVWRYGRPGEKAISAQGVLYIATTDSNERADRGLTAVNLH